MTKNDTVFMKSPAGEIREVAATPEVLTPLMAAGWHQAAPPPAERVKPAAAVSEEEGK